MFTCIRFSAANEALYTQIQQSMMDSLSPKQFRIAILVAQGLNDQEIGNILGHSSSVIRDYIRCLLDDVGCWSRLELAIKFAHELRQGCYNCCDYIAHLHSVSKLIRNAARDPAINEPAEVFFSSAPSGDFGTTLVSC